MKAFEKLLELSSFNVCKTAAEHFCSIVKTNDVFTTVIRVFNSYKVTYIKTSINIIKYIETLASSIVYTKKENYNVTYNENNDALSIFIKAGTIKVTYICKQ
jgi:hypothetical protein